jgi:hypothetical protein
MVRLLLEYDFRLADGASERPENVFNHLFAMVPDVEVKLEFRRRGGE